MDQLKEYYKELGVSGEVYDYAKNIESSLSERFVEFDAVAEFNQLKVLKAMKKNRISEAHLGGTTGYGYEVASVSMAFVLVFCSILLFHFVQQSRYTTATQLERAGIAGA